MNSPQTNEQMDASRPALWKRYWAGSSRRTPLEKLVWWARSAYSVPTASLLAATQRGKRAVSILEIGCGSATTTRDLSQILETGRLAGLDIVPGSLSFARDRMPGFGAHVADARRAPLRDGQFDLVFSVGLIEHFSRDVAKEFVREHMRLARPGGVVAVTVPNGSSPMDLIRKGMGKRWPFGVEHPFSPAELLGFFLSLNLDDCRVHVIRSYRLLATGRISASHGRLIP